MLRPCIQAQSIGVLAPKSLNGQTERASASFLPFNYVASPISGIYFGPIHYQQVYAASLFSALPPQGAFLTYAAFIVDCSSTGAGRASNFEMRTSTTSRGPDELDSLFAENTGDDEVLEFKSALFSFGQNSAPSCPESRGAVGLMLFEIPFFYHPSKGNLLIDIRHSGFVYSNPDRMNPPLADSQKELGDGISRLAALSLSASTAEIMDTEGLVTYFEFWPTPALKISVHTNIVDVVWPVEPKQFALQYREALTTEAGWQLYPGALSKVAIDGAVFSQAKIPLNSSFLDSPKYFRLFWNSPQPGLPDGAAQGFDSIHSSPGN